jgi:hypothetical protein
MTMFGVMMFALTAIVVLEALAILAIARAVGILQVRLGPEPRSLQTKEGLPLYVEAPPVTGYDSTIGKARRLTFEQGRHALVFVDSGCGPCREIVRDAGLVATSNVYDARIAIVARGTHEQNELLRRLSKRLMLLSDPSGDQQRAYAVESTPFAFVIGDSIIQSKGIVNHRDDLEALIESAAGKPSGNSELPALSIRDRASASLDS